MDGKARLLRKEPEYVESVQTPLGGKSQCFFFVNPTICHCVRMVELRYSKVVGCPKKLYSIKVLYLYYIEGVNYVVKNLRSHRNVSYYIGVRLYE